VCTGSVDSWASSNEFLASLMQKSQILKRTLLATSGFSEKSGISRGILAMNSKLLRLVVL